MNKFTFISDHDTKEDYCEWAEKINTLEKEHDISIVYKSSLEVERKQEIIAFANQLSESKKVLIYEQELGLGGVGQVQLLTLIGMATFSIFVVISYAYFGEFGKDFYKVSLGKLFKKNRVSKYDIGNLVLEIKFGNLRLNYIFFDYFEEKDSAEAFSKIANHIVQLDTKNISGDLGRFIYDRKEEKWMLM
ncbi:MAG: hypothetical protein WCL13_01115 [bacterium]